MNNRIFEEIAERLKNCILDGNIALWSQLIKITDDVALKSMNKWFEDYFVAHKVKDCKIVLDNSSNMSTNEFRCSIKAKYQEYDDFTDDFLIKIELDNNDEIFKIVGIEQIYSLNANSNLLWYPALKNGSPWWKTLLSKHEKIQYDNIDIPHNLLARAITRNIRFRESHIQLECASLLTCMMSPVIQSIYQQVEFPHKNSGDKIKTIYNIVRDKFSLQITRPDRDNTWSSKYIAPWYGLDEILADHELCDKIIVGCNAFMTILYSLLRWSGCKASQLVQFRIINQDYLIVRDDGEKLYFISHDRLVPCNKRTIYPSGRISKVFGAEWFIDFKNNSVEASPELIREYNFIAENTFLPKCGLTSNKETFLLLDPNLSSSDFRNSVLFSHLPISSSILLWAKYANQSLFVSKPEAYIYWSVQSNWGGVAFENEEEIFDYVKHLRKKSIFSEDDRIMTADQCIRFKTGCKKDIAVFIFAALKKFLNVQGCVVFTTKNEYCVYRRHTEDEMIVFNVRTQSLQKTIEGDVVLAFDDMESYYQLRDNNNVQQAWYNEMIGSLLK